MFNLLPKDTVFFDLFEGLSKHVVSTSEHLRRLAKDFPDTAGHIQMIRQEEHEADDLAHAALERLDRTFITPFDREDIHLLVGGLDDIVDTIDALAKRFPLFHVKKMDTDVVLLHSSILFFIWSRGLSFKKDSQAVIRLASQVTIDY